MTVLLTAAFLVSLADETTPPPPNGSTLVWLIAAGLAGGGFGFIIQILLRRQTKEKLIAEAADEVASAAKSMLADYREELDRAQREIASLRERVAVLESDLAQARGARERLEGELTAALSRLAAAQQHSADIESRMRVLEVGLERRNPGSLERGSQNEPDP